MGRPGSTVKIPAKKCREDEEEEDELIGVRSERAADDVGVVARRNEARQVDERDDRKLNQPESDEELRERTGVPRRP